MELTIISVLALGFILGIKHAIEPDHVIAVSTIASQSKKLWNASLAGIFWGIGHTLTLFIIGLILIFLKNEITSTWSMSLEFLVGIMLVYLGIVSIRSYRKHHTEEEHQDHHRGVIKQTFLKSLLIGFIHGLAGSAAMVLLTMSTVSTIWEGALYILIFGLGTVTGMLLFTTIIGLPFVLSTKKAKMNQSLKLVAGVISTGFGVYYMYNLGVTEGLFWLWL
ncbi:urease accessory protein UreH domain-containing protein [Pseudoneobacillus sp. C159]